MKTISIIRNHVDFKSILWTAKALSTDRTRPVLHCLQLKNSTLSATDGRRIHQTKILDNDLFEEDTLYKIKIKTPEVIILTPTSDYDYPNLEIAKKPEKKRISGTFNTIKSYPGNLFNAVSSISKQSDIIINDHFFKEALSLKLFKKQVNWTFEVNETDPLKLTSSDSREVTIMKMSPILSHRR